MYEEQITIPPELLDELSRCEAEESRARQATRKAKQVIHNLSSHKPGDRATIVRGGKRRIKAVLYELKIHAYSSNTHFLEYRFRAPYVRWHREVNVWGSDIVEWETP